MKIVNISEAGVHLSRLIDEAAGGEAFIIARAGKPMVKVVPIDPPQAAPKKSRIGFMKGMIKVPDDFDTMMADEIEAMFCGNTDKFEQR